jgi:hypothetical protein
MMELLIWKGELTMHNVVTQDDGTVMHNATTGMIVKADDRIPVLIFSESPEVPWIKPQDINGANVGDELLLLNTSLGFNVRQPESNQM